MNRLTISLLITLLAACGTRTTTREESGTVVPEQIDPYGDPPDYAGDPFAGFPEVYTIEVPGDPVEVVVPVDTTASVPDAVLPFAVQVTAAAEEATAQRLAESVAAGTDAPVFIDREGNYWKVRVGAFASREEAQPLLVQMQEMGFTDAWIVERSP